MCSGALIGLKPYLFRRIIRDDEHLLYDFVKEGFLSFFFRYLLSRMKISSTYVKRRRL